MYRTQNPTIMLEKPQIIRDVIHSIFSIKQTTIFSLLTKQCRHDLGTIMPQISPHASHRLPLGASSRLAKSFWVGGGGEIIKLLQNVLFSIFLLFYHSFWPRACLEDLVTKACPPSLGIRSPQILVFLEK